MVQVIISPGDRLPVSGSDERIILFYAVKILRRKTKHAGLHLLVSYPVCRGFNCRSASSLASRSWASVRGGGAWTGAGADVEGVIEEPPPPPFGVIVK